MYGSALKKIRLIYGFKAKDLSEILDITPSYLSEIENNKKNPSLDLLKKYSEVFNMKLSTLLLLTEKTSELEKKGSPNFNIQKMLVRWIDKMSEGVEDVEESQEKL